MEKLPIDLRTFALETAKDNSVDYATGVRMMADEPTEVAAHLEGCSADDVRAWVSAETDRISDSAIRRLRDEAGAAGDLEQVSLCDRALDGDDAALIECARVIADAQAQVD